MNVRYAFLDVYRGIIVLLMIEGHAVREFLQPALQSSAGFRIHELVHGVTGPGFLFGAGLTFGISAQRRREEYSSLTPALTRRVRRILLLICLGYALHLPFLSLSKTISETTPAGWEAFFQFDVMQCIGFTLAILQVALAIFPDRLFLWFLPGASLMILFVTPLVWQADLTGLTPAISMALSGAGGSFYPLFPYSAFLLAGAFASYEFMRFVPSGRGGVFIARLTLTGIGLILAGGVLENVSGGGDFWLESPNFMLMKLGSLLILMSIAWLLSPDRVGYRWLTWTGQESLFVYVAHLLLLYGSVANPEVHLSAIWKARLEWIPAVGVSVLISSALVGSAWLWNRVKTNHPVLFRSVVWWMIAAFSLEFLIDPY